MIFLQDLKADDLCWAVISTSVFLAEKTSYLKGNLALGRVWSACLSKCFAEIVGSKHSKVE